MSNPKFKLIEDFYKGRIVFRICSVKDFGRMPAGSVGGIVEKESNLSQEGDSWIGYDSKVYGDSRVEGNATIAGNCTLRGNVLIKDSVTCYGKIKISGKVIISGGSKLRGIITIKSKNLTIDGRSSIGHEVKLVGFVGRIFNTKISGSSIKGKGHISCSEIMGKTEIHVKNKLAITTGSRISNAVITLGSFYCKASSVFASKIYGDEVSLSNWTKIHNSSVSSIRYIKIENKVTILWSFFCGFFILRSVDLQSTENRTYFLYEVDPITGLSALNRAKLSETEMHNKMIASIT